jgi:L-ascorbate metabolism protein UlaG (beta-lactamase superfamily)
MTDSLHWLGHDAFRIDGPPVVYIDPFQLSGPLPPADIILITHAHFDHMSAEDIARIRTPRTVLVGPREVADKIPGTTLIAAGQSLEVGGLAVRAVPAYNPAKRYHPSSAGYVGYVFALGGVTYYHAGDSDEIPEMANLKPDVALLPVSGTYVMTAPEAAAAARHMKPSVVVPMHYGSIIGSDADARELATLLEGSGIQVVIKAKE